VGTYGKWFFSDGAWRDGLAVEEPYLAVEILGSDIATVEFAPSYDASGRFYLGVDPRVYFEDASASQPVDNRLESINLAKWARETVTHPTDAADLERLMATDEISEVLDDFVEDTLNALLDALGLPRIPQLD
jgi:hypothetical protein